MIEGMDAPELATWQAYFRSRPFSYQLIEGYLAGLTFVCGVDKFNDLKPEDCFRTLRGKQDHTPAKPKDDGSNMRAWGKRITAAKAKNK